MKKILLTTAALACAALLNAQQKHEVGEYRYAGPFPVSEPVKMESVNLSGKAYDEADVLKTPLHLSLLEGGEVRTSRLLPNSEEKALHLIGFRLETTDYASVTLDIRGMAQYELYVNGKREEKTRFDLEPSTYDVVVKYLSVPGRVDSMNVTYGTDSLSHVVQVKGEAKRLYTITDVMAGKRYGGVSLSSDGKYLIVTTSTVFEDGHRGRSTQVREVKTGRVVDERSGIRWMPRTSRYCYEEMAVDGRTRLVAADPATGRREVLTEDLPSGSWTMAPTEEYLIVSEEEKGPRKGEDVFEVVTPDDRQPGWRNRNRLFKYDLATGMLQPLTFGYNNVYLSDISQDGRSLLVSKNYERLESRPTTLTSLYRIRLLEEAPYYEVDTLVTGDGFMSGAQFSPDGRQVLLQGSPEAFGGVGNVVPQGRIPNMFDYQLYVMSIDGIQEGMVPVVHPLTRDFHPNVQHVVWSPSDGYVYFSAEDKDAVHLFRMDTERGAIQRIDVPEEVVMQFSVASDAPLLAFAGQAASHSDRLYTVNTKSLKCTLVEDLRKEMMDEVKLGDCVAWNYRNAQGDSICCRYYLPPSFDASKKYPMIVYYYGGCSPTSRNFESRYPQHAYAAQGYVVLVVNPSGATGFGQEFASRHVNTAGEGVAEDIIGATRTFVAENTFVDAKKIGCIGASYGGFMTQYLQTKTDIFAAAVSHAGISDHTSYWGEGYWGYSYSEVSMANSYPWGRKDLYVDRSPLYNADKIHTPLLFLHGTDDTNVPVGESIQMFTALKLLGRPTAMVLVEGENHGIMDYDKRLQWQYTIDAWFARYLKGDDRWWKALYPTVPTIQK